MRTVLLIAFLLLGAAPDGGCQPPPTDVQAPTAEPPAAAPPAAEPPAAEPPVAGDGYEAGDAVEIEWRGDWWPGRILQADGQRFQVRYDGFDASWDEWVAPQRLRAAGAGQTTAAPPPAPAPPPPAPPPPASAGAPGADALHGTWQYESWISNTRDRGRTEMMNGDVFYWMTLRANGSWTLSSTTRWAPNSADFMNWGSYTFQGGVLELNQTSAEQPVFGRFTVQQPETTVLVLTEAATGDVIRLRRGRG